MWEYWSDCGSERPSQHFSRSPTIRAIRVSLLRVAAYVYELCPELPYVESPPSPAEASERSSQAKNRDVALHRLRLALAITYCTVSAPNGPTNPWRSRVKDGRIVVAADHEDYLALLAEASNQLALVGNFHQQRACRASPDPS